MIIIAVFEPNVVVADLASVIFPVAVICKARPKPQLVPQCVAGGVFDGNNLCADRLCERHLTGEIFALLELPVINVPKHGKVALGLLGLVHCVVLYADDLSLFTVFADQHLPDHSVQLFVGTV